MIIEDQRHVHEDLERLERAIADRVLEEPKQDRDRLSRDHQISQFLDHIRDQSSRLIKIYEDEDKAKHAEIQSLSTGDPFESFYKELDAIKAFHRKYPNEPVENLEKAYKRRGPEDNAAAVAEIEAMFTGEESYGRFFDLTTHHKEFLNLPGIKNIRRITYLQYIDMFDIFTPPECPIKRHDKLRPAYFMYVSALAEYLESFMRRTKPLEDLAKLFESFDAEFEEAWENHKIPGWEQDQSKSPANADDTDAIRCDDCDKDFTNGNSFKAHLTGKKHIRAAEARKSKKSTDNGTNGETNSDEKASAKILGHHLQEKAIAIREFRVHRFVTAMQTERSDTKVNIERKQGMTDRERQQELAALYAEPEEATGPKEADPDSDGEEKIYNPLKLPLAWDGKPIPFWLYKLHGLGVEFACEICGNFVYMGRRAFDKHFNEPRHIYGLKCLGITNTTLFREITNIGDAQKLWEKIQRDRRLERLGVENVIQMEDGEGNVMPEKVYYDLQKQGLL